VAHFDQTSTTKVTVKTSTTKVTKAHEGKATPEPSCSFVPFVVQAFFCGRIVKLSHYRIWGESSGASYADPNWGLDVHGQLSW
jgi:hypothetical protein